MIKDKTTFIFNNKHPEANGILKTGLILFASSIDYRQNIRYLTTISGIQNYNVYLEEFKQLNSDFDELDFLNENFEILPIHFKLLRAEIHKTKIYLAKLYESKKSETIKYSQLKKMIGIYENELKGEDKIIEFIENKISEIKYKPELKQVPEDAKHIFTDLGYTIFEIASKHYIDNSKALQADFSVLWYYLNEKAYEKTEKDLVVCTQKDFVNYVQSLSDECSKVDRIISRYRYYKGDEKNEQKVNQLISIIPNHIKDCF